MDNLNLKTKLRRAERGRQLRAFLLVLPLFAFLIGVFVVPIGMVMFYAVVSDEMQEALPLSSEMLVAWDGKSEPSEEMFAVLIPEIAQAYESKTIARAATRLNQEASGMRSDVMKLARRAGDMTPPYRDAAIKSDPAWGEITQWRHMKAAASLYTPSYILKVLDREQTFDGAIVEVDPSQQLYITFLKRTFWISLITTLACIVIGYPLAYFAAHARPAIAYLVLAAVLLPFWISILVRTAAWMTVLQQEGIINSLLLDLGLIDTPIQMIFNRFGVYVAMIHVLLPFLVLPIYNVMRTINPAHIRAALSLGAKPWKAFVTVYMPQSLPGVSAGALLAFILALGYYITPTLVGGPSDQMLSFLVTQFALELGNWHMAGAAATLLLIATLLSYAVFRKLFGARGFSI